MAEHGRETLLRIVAMLIKLCKLHGRS
jgi:hypothetical protein